MVSLRTGSASCEKSETFGRIGGTPIIKALPLIDRLVIGAMVAKECKREAATAACAQRAIIMNLRAGRFESAERFAIQFDLATRLSELAKEAARLESKRGFDWYYRNAAKIAQRYGLKEEMKTAALKAIEEHINNQWDGKEPFRLARNFEISDAEVRQVAQKVIAEKDSIGGDEKIARIAKCYGLEDKMKEAARRIVSGQIRLFQFETARKAAETTRKTAETYGITAELADIARKALPRLAPITAAEVAREFGLEGRDEAAREAFACEMEKGDCRSALAIAKKFDLSDGVKTAGTVIITNMLSSKQEFPNPCDAEGISWEATGYGISAGELNKLVKAEFEKRIGDDRYAAFRIAKAYGLKEEERRAAEMIIEKETQEGQYGHAAALAEQYGFTRQLRELGRKLIEIDMYGNPDSKYMNENAADVEKTKTECGLSDADIKEAADNALMKALGEGRYEKAEAIAERYGLEEIAFRITGILDRLR